MNAYNAMEPMLTESLLNLAWLAIAFLASVTVLSRRRDPRTIVALLGVLALLFPIISISDDFNADRTLEETVAVLVILCAVVSLIALFRLTVLPLTPPPVHRVVLSDPRSPPRG